jgi:hypothetical protein
MVDDKERLTPVCVRLFEEVKSALPTDIAERMTCSRAVRNHGSFRTVLLFNVWDRFQSDVLPKQHFCYCLAFDPQRLISGGTDWYFHLWLNTVRIYRDRLSIKQKLETKLASACPRGFCFNVGDRYVEAKMNFNWTKNVNDLIGFLKPRYVALIQAMHPVLMPIIDSLSVYGKRSDIKAEIVRRGKLPFRPVRVMRPELIEEYSRAILPSWRPEILKNHGYKCAHCGEDLRGGGYLWVAKTSQSFENLDFLRFRANARHVMIDVILALLRSLLSVFQSHSRTEVHPLSHQLALRFRGVRSIPLR